MTNYTYEQRKMMRPKLEALAHLCHLAIIDIDMCPNSDDFGDLLDGIQDIAEELTAEVINEN